MTHLFRTIMTSLVPSLALAGTLYAVEPMAVPASDPPPRFLRTMMGLQPPAHLPATSTALVRVDYQQVFAPGGGIALTGTAEALHQAAAILARARVTGMPVFHVRHQVTGSAWFSPDTPQSAILPEVMPLPGEPLLAKRTNGPFASTDLDQRLHAAGVKQAIIIGFMTHLAVDTTAREATALGYQVVVVADACATRDLPGPDGTGTVPAALVQAVSLAAIADRFAWVADSDDVLPRMVPRPIEMEKP